MSKKKRKYPTTVGEFIEPDIGEEDWRVLNERLEEMYPEIQTIWEKELKPEIEKLWKLVSPWMGKKASGQIFNFHDNGEMTIRLSNVVDFFVIMCGLAIIKSKRK